MNLRPYQQDALVGIQQAFERADSALLVMPTGTGKTIVFAHLIAEYAKTGRVMVLAHREELVDQALKAIEDVTGIRADVEMADQHASRNTLWNSPVVVSTVQTQDAGRGENRRRQKFDPQRFSLLIVDEGHHAPAKSWKASIEHYRQNPNLKVLGCTATPDRHDEKALGQVFKEVACEYALLDAIEDGWLVEPLQDYVTITGLDYSGVGTVAGDFNQGQLAVQLEAEKPLQGIADATIRKAKGRQTLVFTVTVAQAKDLTVIFNSHRPDCARVVTGKTPKDERRLMMREYRAGKFQILANVGVATEGFDVPGVEVVVMARPTKSRALYAQMLGRGTRTLPDVVDGLRDAQARRDAIAASSKPALLVVDFVGNCGQHKLISSVDVLGGTYEDDVVELAVREVQCSGYDRNVREALIEAAKKRDEERQKEEELAAKRRHGVTGRATWTEKQVNPFTLFDVVPRREPGYHAGRKPTEKMIALLAKFGVDAADMTFTQAHQAIDIVIKRSKAGKASYRQVKALKRMGHHGAGDYSREQASEIFDRVNQWRKKKRAVKVAK